MPFPAASAPRELSITTGGPFHQLARRLRLISPQGRLRVWWLTALAWSPLLVDTLARAAVGAPVDPITRDLSTHIRFLVALPLLVWSEGLLEPQCRAAVRLLYQGELADRAALDRVIDAAERMRDRPWVEGTLAAAAFVGGQLALWGVIGPTGVFHGIAHADITVARIWYAGLALPLLQFLVLRWVWRWVIWTVVLVRMSRLRLDATATHPDQAAGLGFLSAPVTGFAAFVLAFATVLAGAWGTQLIAGQVTVPALVPTVVLFVIIALAVSCGPLLLFTPHLYRAGRRAVLLYHPFAREYVLRFHRKWIERRTDDQVLGTPDIQSFADLGSAYQAMASTGWFVVGRRKLVEVTLAAIVPMLPLVATVVPLDEWARRIGSALFAGLLP